PAPELDARLKSLVLVLCIGCAARPEPSGVPILFVHGVKGSTLVDPRGCVRYLTLAQALGLSTPTLALPLGRQGDAQERDGLAAGEILRAVGVPPFGERVYGPVLTALEAAGRPFYAFAYDWRRDNL